jgi:two-component system NtrC family sensor kinase
MRKVLSAVFLSVVLFNMGVAQSKFADSLKTVLATESNPIQRFNLIVKILEYEDVYLVNQIDSSACKELLRIAQSQKNDAMLATSYNWIGYYLFQNKGDNAAALEYYFKALPLAEKVNDKRRISSICFDIGGIYGVLQNDNEFLNYTRRGGRNLPDISSPKYYYMLVQYQRNMANYFLRTNQLDSAQQYGLAMTQSSATLNATVFITQLINFNARLNIKLGNITEADRYFKEGLALVDSSASNRAVAIYQSYIPFLIEQRRFEEAIVLTRKYWKRSKRFPNSNLQLSAARLKRQLFDKLNQKDSAYYYLNVETNAKDLIFNQNNQNIIQALAFKEQLRGIEEEGRKAAYQTQLKQYALLGSLGVFSIIALLLYRNNLSRKKANELLQQQKAEVETQKKNVEHALTELKSAQSQLIQSEKMASLGELTAGIAHEIQNPLNFVNNFSEMSEELLTEMKDELNKGNLDGAKSIAKDVIENQQKVLHHGKRADAIVKSMLQHSRSSNGVKEPTDINALTSEYLRLAYHGLRARDNSFNATMKSEFDESIGNINIIPQDIGRVILNIVTNAFYAVNEKSTLRQAQGDRNYEPIVTVTTKRTDSRVLISIKDNGNGIPQKVLDKIFQPFFTTKPTGQGTGLGLSLSYDIVKAHGGEIKVSTKENEGTEFTIKLPV